MELDSKVARTVPDAFTDIRAERTRQDAQWGGPAHDDTHIEWDWFEYIGSQIQKANRDRWAIGESSPRERLVKIAALAVAGIESIDRIAAVNAAEDAR